MNDLHELHDPWKSEIDGYDHVVRLHLELRAQLARRWQRALPFNDELFDRWERAAFLGFGSGSSIYDSSVVLGNVRVGENTWIGPYTLLDGSGGLSIGAWCSISAGVQIYTHDSVAWALTAGRATATRAPTSIGDCCYVGPASIVEKGVTIADHCIVGANSLVNRDIPPFSIAVGSPCRIAGQVRLTEEGGVELVWHKSTP